MKTTSAIIAIIGFFVLFAAAIELWGVQGAGVWLLTGIFGYIAINE